MIVSGNLGKRNIDVEYSLYWSKLIYRKIDGKLKISDATIPTMIAIDSRLL